MLIRLIRNQPRGKALFGRLYIDGAYFCDTLEHTDYAILSGFYRVRVTMSPRFHELLPILDGVLGRTGIRIHAGNTIEHTRGCILVGDEAIGLLGDEARLLSSRKALERVRTYLLNYQKSNPNEEIYIEIQEPDSPLYNTHCSSSECACEKEIRSANFARRHSSSILDPTRVSDDC